MRILSLLIRNQARALNPATRHSPPRPPRKKKSSFQPLLETLEDRCVPSNVGLAHTDPQLSPSLGGSAESIRVFAPGLDNPRGPLSDPTASLRCRSGPGTLSTVGT